MRICVTDAVESSHTCTSTLLPGRGLGHLSGVWGHELHHAVISVIPTVFSDVKFGWFPPFHTFTFSLGKLIKHF